MHHILSLGAGVNSTALLHVIVDERLPLDEVIFADTGAEKPETYEYVEKWIRPFLESRAIPFVTVKAKETLMERCMRGHTIPDRRYRWSTRDYKITPIYKHLKPNLPATVYLGIAWDEPDRVKESLKDDVTNNWPLVDRKMTRDDCVKLIESKGWPEPVKSGCWFCPFTRLDGWRWLWKEHPGLFKKAVEIEQNGSKYPQFTLYGKLKKRRGLRLAKLRSQALLLPLVGNEQVRPAGLAALAVRFEAEAKSESKAALAALEQVSLTEDNDCSGYCMT